LVSGLFLREKEGQLTFPTQNMPIIVFSADSDDLSLVPEGKWLSLPFETEQLLTAIKEAFTSILKAAEH
ncbi:hypothetical protein, partial [Reichenbachiella sp.]